MKKIYILILLSTLVKIGSAQLSLTRTANEPIFGDVERRKNYDSTSALPTNTGANQVWNFTTLTTNTSNLVSTTYTTPATYTASSGYPGTTIVSADGASTYNFYKSTATNYELLGTKQSSITLTFSNSAVMAVWPIGPSYTNNDLVAGTAKISTSLTLTGPFNGTIDVASTGTGTLNLPNSLTFTNVLLVRSNLTGTATFTIPLVGTITATVINVSYQYYDASQKFPILTINVSSFNSSAGNQSGKTISLNNDALVGINELSNSIPSLNLFPNPASNQFNITLNNKNAETVSVQVLNAIGQVVKTIDLGNTKGDINTTVDAKNLNAGVYYVKTTMGKNTSVKKLVIQ